MKAINSALVLTKFHYTKLNATSVKKHNDTQLQVSLYPPSESLAEKIEIM